MKNSTSGGHRPDAEYKSELAQALSEFEQGESPLAADHTLKKFRLHESVRDSLGLGHSEQVVNREALFYSPYPYMHGHGAYICGLLSTPTSADDGVSEFTSLFVVASPTQLLTVIMDPPATYAGPFGQRLINRMSDHAAGDSDDVGATLLMIIRDNVTSINFALRELSLDVGYVDRVIGDFGISRSRDTFESLKRIESHLVRLQIEVDSLASVVQATSDLVQAISESRIDVDGEDQIFDRRHEISASVLVLQALQTISVRERLEKKIDALLSKCDLLRDKFFVEATHRIGAVAALLLVPTFIVGLYGQNFDFPERQWENGYLYSWGLIVVSTGALFAYLRRKRWL